MLCIAFGAVPSLAQTQTGKDWISIKVNSSKDLKGWLGPLLAFSWKFKCEFLSFEMPKNAPSNIAYNGPRDGLCSWLLDLSFASTPTTIDGVRVYGLKEKQLVNHTWGKTPPSGEFTFYGATNCQVIANEMISASDSASQIPQCKGNIILAMYRKESQSILGIYQIIDTHNRVTDVKTSISGETSREYYSCFVSTEFGYEYSSNIIFIDSMAAKSEELALLCDHANVNCSICGVGESAIFGNGMKSCKISIIDGTYLYTECSDLLIRSE